MSHPQMTAMIAVQHCRDMQRLSEQGRQVTLARGHGVRVRTASTPVRRSVWSRVASRLFTGLGKPNADPVSAPTVAPAELKPA